MMRKCFLSVVLPVDRFSTTAELAQLVEKVSDRLHNSFTDYEVILVDNRSGLKFEQLEISDPYRRNCYVFSLASEVVFDVAILAGVERANGDYVFVLGPSAGHLENQIVALFDAAQKGFDIVYVRNVGPSGRQPWSRHAFYALIRNLSKTNLDPRAVHAYLFSRRAINSVVRQWTATTFLNEAAFSSGFLLAALDVQEVGRSRRRNSRDEHRLAWGALIRHTNFPLLLGQAAVWTMGIVCVLATVNATAVRLFGRNIMGAAEEHVPGWAFTVVLISGGLFVTNLAIYAILRTLYVLLDENRSRPNYIVERFGRL